MDELKRVDGFETGINIKRMMRLRKIDTYELSQKLGMRSTTSIYAWTQGKIIPSTDNCVKLAQIFGCTVDDILVLED